MDQQKFIKTVYFVAIANFLYFIVEFFYAHHFNSSSLFADSIDFLEDGAVNSLIIIAIHFSSTARAKVGIFLAFVLLIPCGAAIISIIQKIFFHPEIESSSVSFVGAGALIVNSFCVFLLTSFKNVKTSLVKAAFLASRNDAIADIAIIITALITTIYSSIWPDVLVGMGIVAMNGNAALSVYKTAKQEM